MKRLMVWILAICLLAGVIGCAGKDVPTEPTQAPQTTDAVQPTEAPTETQQATDAPVVTEEPAPAFDAGMYRLTVYTVGEISFAEDRLADLGIENTVLTLNEDHTGTFVQISETVAIEWTDDGQLLINGISFYSMERIDDDTILMTMGDALLTLSKGEPAQEQPTDRPEETEAPAEQQTQAPSAEQPLYPGVPYGDSDGVIDRAKLLALYRWLNELQDSYKYALTFDEISEAAGKPGCDRHDNDGKSHSAHWTDGSKLFITVTFRNKNETWTCGAISSSGITDEWKKADISGFPRIGSSTPAGTHATEAATDEIKVGASDATVSVTAQLPTEGWYPIKRSDTIRYYSTPNAEKADESQSYILIESKPTLKSINFYQEKFEELKTLDSRTIGGVEMQGRTYRYIGMNWIEYYGSIAENVWISIRMTNVDFSAGTETEAIVNSLSFTVQ